MKKVILFALVIGAFSFQLKAQNDIIFKIHHKLGESDFSLQQEATNNLDNNFKVKRLEYYISEVSIIHDGGLESIVEDLWILVNAATDTEVYLGQLDITTVEKIKFHIGVDEAHNHLDPSLWPSDHPLAPKSPSMHWGWTSGYRFLAFEGDCGSNFNQVFQLHSLGDQNYKSVELELDVEADDGQITIDVYANYERALEDIEINSGVIVHGDGLQAAQCLRNFRNLVFSPSETVSSAIDFSEIIEFNVFPNPVVNEVSTLKLDLKESGFEYDLTITSLDGRQLDYLYNVTDNQNIDFTNRSAGMYFINLVKEGQTIITKKVFVK